MIQTLNLSQQKRQHTWNVESNHQLMASIFKDRKKSILKTYDWKDMIWKRFDFEKLWKLEKKLHWKQNLPSCAILALNAQNGAHSGV